MNLNKLTELSNSLYLVVATEFKKNGIPPEVGRFVVESVYRRVTEDAMSALAARNTNLESQLQAKMAELEKLKSEEVKEVEKDDTV